MVCAKKCKQKLAHTKKPEKDAEDEAKIRRNTNAHTHTYNDVATIFYFHNELKQIKNANQTNENNAAENQCVPTSSTGFFEQIEKKNNTQQI